MAGDMAPLPEPNKPARARCGHMCKSGCSIYDAKPDSCSAFICFWLASQLFEGGMPLAWRPDKVGAVIDVQTRTVRSEEHTSELQSLMRISYAVFCLKKKNNNTSNHQQH